MDYGKMFTGLTAAEEALPPELVAFIRSILTDDLQRLWAEEQERRERGEGRWPD